jgi:hypothetical protein
MYSHNFKMEEYVVSLLDPFDITIRQPKIDDGRASVSAGVRLRATGTITIDDTNRLMCFYLFPGVANCVSWEEDVGGKAGPSLFPDHSSVDGLSVQNAIRHRIVSCGLRMELLNATLENDGFWEAARMPVSVSDFSFVGGCWKPVGELPSVTNLSNYPTYQSGKLRDISRFQFKLNPENVDVEYSSAMIKPEFDMIVIKINGRTAGNTQLMYNCVSNQEVIYKEGTALSRLQTPSRIENNIGLILSKARYQLPAVQVE